MWVDATIAASFITDPKQCKVADKVAFAQAPIAVTPKGANWLWAWALAIPAGSQERRRGAEVHHLGDVEGLHQAGRQGRRLGARCPPARASRPTRTPSSRRPRSSPPPRRRRSTAPTRTTARCRSRPYVGVQFAAIPEFQAIGVAVGQQMSAALAGKVTVDAGAEDLADRGRARDEQGAATTSKPPLRGRVRMAAPCGRGRDAGHAVPHSRGRPESHRHEPTRCPAR